MSEKLIDIKIFFYVLWHRIFDKKHYTKKIEMKTASDYEVCEINQYVNNLAYGYDHKLNFK